MTDFKSAAVGESNDVIFFTLYASPRFTRRGDETNEGRREIETNLLYRCGAVLLVRKPG